MTNPARHIMIAGGKTGGHLFPGIAVAQALEKIYPGTRILFVGTDTQFERTTLERYGFSHAAILSQPVKGKNIFRKMISAGMVAISIFQSMKIIRQFKPDVVLGVGGFSSFAVVFSAWLLRIPTAIQEQNSIPGITNRLLSRFVERIFISFNPTIGFSGKNTVVHTGNPVRTGSVQSSSASGTDEEWTLPADPDGFTILVTGGSQGAHSINAAFLEALKLMPYRKELFIIHQTGRDDEKWVRDEYQRMGINGPAQAFFHHMPRCQDMADLVICRSGAGTLSELTLKGLPAILIPFPHAADDHQTANAKTLADQNAAIMIPDALLTPELLFETVTALKNDRAALEKMGRASKAMAMEHADEIIAGELIQLAGSRG